MSDERDPDRDQVLPVPNDTEAIHDLVAADLAERKAFGTRKYGTPLQAHNGRNALLDAYEEALDLCVYLKQAMVERDGAEVTEPVGTATDICACGHHIKRHDSFSGCLAHTGEGFCPCTLNQKDFAEPGPVDTATNICECGHRVSIHGDFSGCLDDNGDGTQYCTCTLNQKDFS